MKAKHSNKQSPANAQGPGSVASEPHAVRAVRAQRRRAGMDRESQRQVAEYLRSGAMARLTSY